MPFWKHLLLNLYYHGSQPIRWRTRRRAIAGGKLPLMVLFYHRVADEQPNPWTVSNHMFVRQIRWLRKRFEFVSLEEAQRRIRSGANRRPCVSITFDDGYADNCRQAIPLLVKERIPCTYFVTLQNVLDGSPFPHDLAMGQELPPNTLEQLRAMADAGIEIGAHTWTHANLAQVTDPRQLYREVVSARNELQRRLGRPVRYFAFPYGQHASLSRAAFDLACQAGYEAACSAYGGFNFAGQSAFHLQRIPVDATMVRLKNWVSLDPRKLRTPRYVYEPTTEEWGTVPLFVHQTSENPSLPLP